MIFKGDEFVNRYRLEGELCAITPTHIGTGGTRPEKRSKSKEDNQEQETQEIAVIARDFRGLPYLPGSALRGVVRHYLLQIFRSFKNRLADDPNFENEEFRQLDQQEQILYGKNKASLLEQLFGTPFWESKVEFWDAPVLNRVEAPPDFIEKGWNENGQSYVVRSVAINPETGAAEADKLYAFEVAPPGMRYHMNMVSQNLTSEEFGFLLFGLHGFNSEIFQMTIGAMAGRGFGRMHFELKNIYRVERADLKNWITLAAASNHAGYKSLPKVEGAIEQLVKPFKDAFQERMRRTP